MRSTRFLTVLAGLGVALVAAATARAESLDFYKTTDGVNYTQCVGALSYTRTANAQIAGPSLDRIDIRFANIGAIVAPTEKLVALEGTWTATNGSMAVIQKYGTSTKSWYRYFDNTYTPMYIDEGNVVGSYINFPYNTSSGVNWVETGFGTPNVNNTPYGYSLGASIIGSWYTHDRDAWLGDGDLIASFYVTPNAGLRFTAAGLNGVELYTGLGFIPVATNCGGYFTIVPEPSTLLLVACGLVGLLGFAWRKR